MSSTGYKRSSTRRKTPNGTWFTTIWTWGENCSRRRSYLGRDSIEISIQSQSRSWPLFVEQSCISYGKWWRFDGSSSLWWYISKRISCPWNNRYLQNRSNKNSRKIWPHVWCCKKCLERPCSCHSSTTTRDGYRSRFTLSRFNDWLSKRRINSIPTTGGRCETKRCEWGYTRTFRSSWWC